ncbi:hypothetical protein JCM8202_005429 [Rhodotorula sphaerocarpa]
MSDSQSVPLSSAPTDAAAGSAASAPAAAHGADETARRLANLQAMLNRLQVPKLATQSSALAPKRSTSTGSTGPIRTAAPSLSSELNGAGRPLVQRAARGKTCLQGVSAFVDVRTADGDDSGMIFVDMLKDLGARVTMRPSSLTTHIIYKSGRSTTLDFVRQAPTRRKPHLVGIAWVVRCAETHSRVDEAQYKIDEAGSAVQAGGGKENMTTVTVTAQAALGHSGKAVKGGHDGVKRRKSMEPRAFATINSGRTEREASAAADLTGRSKDSALKAGIAASIERARRKSLQHAPRIGSPLAGRIFVRPDAVQEEEPEK